MKSKIFLYTIAILFIIILQTTFLDYIRIFNVKPNIMIIFILCIALLRGQTEGAVIGFITGLTQDIVTGKMIGFYALLGLYLGLVTGIVNRRIYRENYLVVAFFTFVSTVIYEFLVYFFLIYVKHGTDLIYIFKKVILPEAVYNIIASVVVFTFVLKMDERFDKISSSVKKY